jgi:hypothetical protein
MIEDYENGITPNPDVMCNREIKFGWFLNKCLGTINSKDKENTWIATGIKVHIKIMLIFFFFIYTLIFYLKFRPLCSTRTHRFWTS